jgi:two-component system CheB/CheR fusion protein
MFVPMDLKRRVFQKVARGRVNARALQGARPSAPAEGDASGADLREAAFRAGSVAQLVVDRHGVVTLANDRASGLFRLGMADVGRPLSDLDVSYRPIELRSLIDQAYGERRMIARTGVEWRPHGSSEQRWFDVQVIPLNGDDGAYLGTSIVFADVTAQRQLQAELQQSENELQAAYEELQSTNEELETTNEELQSTVEELETTNEELHSTNEELETMNEELQTTNEELQTMNDQLQIRSDELNQLNRFLEQVFTSLRSGVAVVDQDFRILVWNRRAEDLWGVRRDEAHGAHFFHLDVGLPLDRLRDPVRAALTHRDAESQELVVPAVNRRGKGIQCRVVCTPLVGRDDEEAHGVILTMEEVASPSEVKAGAEP